MPLPTPPVDSPPNRPAVLVVDDDPDILGLIRSVLVSAGFRVLTAEDSKQALTLAEEDPPALVVLDLLLPDVGGEEVVRTLRDRFGADLPIILISASGRVRQAASALGILAYLDKPFEVDTLMGLVEHRLPERAPDVAAVWQAAERLLATLRRSGATGARAVAQQAIEGRAPGSGPVA